MRVNGNLDFHTLGSGELRNAIIERLTSVARGAASHAAGRLVFDTDLGAYFYSDGVAWVQLATGGDAAAVQAEVDAMQIASGNIYNTDGTYNAAPLDALGNVTGSTSLADALSDLDAAITAAAGVDTLGELTDVNIVAAASGDILAFDGTSWVDQTLVDLGIATAAHVHTLDELSNVTDTSAAGDVMYATAPAVWATAAPGSISGVQAYDLVLEDLSALAEVSADQMLVGTATGVFGYASITAAGLALLDDADADAQRTTLGLNAGGAGDIWVEKAGDVMTGNLDMGGNDVVLSAAPTDPNDATNKAYVDSLVSAGATWRNPVVDPDLVDVIGANVADPETDYGLSVGDNVSFIATASFTASLGAGSTVSTGIGDIINLTITAAGVGDYTLIETPLTAGDRFIISADHGVTIGSGLTGLSYNGEALAKGDLIDFTGTGDGSVVGSWSLPDGRVGGSEATAVEIEQGITVLVADPDSVHHGDTFLYNAQDNAWVLIAGPGAIGAGNGLSYTGNTLNVGVDNSTISIVSGNLQVLDSGITNAKLVNSSLTITASDLSTDDIALGETLTVANGRAIVSSIAGNTLTVTADLATTAVVGVASFAPANFAVDGAGEVTFDQTSVSFTVAADTGTAETVAGGDTLTIAGGTGIDSVVSATDTITLNLNAAANDLSDVVSTGHVDGDLLVSDGTNFVRQQAYFLYTAGAAATSHTVTHNLGVQFCNVTVVDTADTVIIPDSIVFDTINGLTVTFTAAIECKVVVMGIA